MNAIHLGTVERAPLADPCEVCGDRSHTRTHHGELVQHDGQVMTEDELVLRFANPRHLYAHLIDDDPPTAVRSIP